MVMRLMECLSIVLVQHLWNLTMIVQVTASVTPGLQCWATSEQCLQWNVDEEPAEVLKTEEDPVCPLG